MTEPLDPFERLRELNPAQPEDVAGAEQSVEAQRTLEAIVRDDRQPVTTMPLRPRLKPLRRRTYVLILVATAGAVAAGAWALTRGASQHITVGCYASVSLEARTVVVPAGLGTPASACRSVWRRGDFGRRVVPHLEACVLPSGAIGVFPSPTTSACTKLKLQPLSSAPPANKRSAVSVVKLKTALVTAFLAEGCMSKAQALNSVRSTFRRLGVKGWKTVVGGRFSHQRPCASLAFDEPRQRVILVPMPLKP